MRWLRIAAVTFAWLFAATATVTNAQEPAPAEIAPHERSYELWKKALSRAQAPPSLDLHRLQHYQAAIDIAEKVTRQDPSNTAWQLLLGESYSRMASELQIVGRPDEALEFYRADLKVTQRLAGPETRGGPMRRRMAGLNLRISQLQLDQGKTAESSAAASEALALVQALASESPEDVAIQRELMEAYALVGRLQGERQDFTAALAAQREALAIAEQRAKAMPADSSRLNDLSGAYRQLGTLFDRQGSAAEALSNLQHSAGITRQWIQARPDDNGILVSLSGTYAEIGRIFVRQGDWQRGLEAFSECLDIFRRLAAREPGNILWQLQQALVQVHVGTTLGKLGRPTEARKSLLHARESLSKFNASYPEMKREDDLTWIERELENLN